MSIATTRLVAARDGSSSAKNPFIFSRSSPLRNAQHLPSTRFAGMKRVGHANR